ncbi:hypothetical protein BJY52DRAFT_1209627 [Lactarius psammicola]|nr:hypothetical protein BJY52DRAFT_1209627 [Lactarius psammicola]
MPRILNDPTQAVSPNFEGPEWEFLRQAIIKTHLGNIPLTAEEAARQLREAWTKDNDTRVAAWNVQLEKDQAERDKRDRQAREVEEARRAKLENEWIEPRPAPYALNKINNLEYVELDYFTALRPSKNIRNDGDLSWEEMLEAKTVMLHFMAQFGLWPTAHAVTLKAFFVALERHPRRREWFHALARNEGFNIELINDDPSQARANLASPHLPMPDSISPATAQCCLTPCVLFAVARPKLSYYFGFIPAHIFADAPDSQQNSSSGLRDRLGSTSVQASLRVGPYASRPHPLALAIPGRALKKTPPIALASA